MTAIKEINTGPYNRVELQKAKLILTETREVVNSFFNSYNQLRNNQSENGAVLNREEQDLLRAMLVFASAGLDSLVKQLVEDCLVVIVEHDEGAQKQLELFVNTQLKNIALDSNEIASNSKFLSSVLISSSPRNSVVFHRISDLKSGSMQSKDELLRAAAAFAITREQICESPDQLKEVFDVRNQIIHEMDIRFDDRGHRIERNEGDMVRYANKLLETAENFIAAINDKLGG